MATKRKHISIFEDSSSSLELDAFKKKIKQLYDEILERTYKIENPGASPEEVKAYVEENGIQFPDEDVSEDSDEIDNLMEMLDGMVDTDVQEAVSDLSTEDKPKEYRGDELSSKSHEKGDRIETKDLKDKMGGLFSVKIDERKRTYTKAPKIPIVPTIKRDTSIAHKESFAPLIEKFRDELRSLADRQRSGVQKLRDRL